jgi:hypothetical protein
MKTHLLFLYTLSCGLFALEVEHASLGTLNRLRGRPRMRNVQYSFVDENVFCNFRVGSSCEVAGRAPRTDCMFACVVR